MLQNVREFYERARVCQELLAVQYFTSRALLEWREVGSVSAVKGDDDIWRLSRAVCVVFGGDNDSLEINFGSGVRGGLYDGGRRSCFCRHLPSLLPFLRLW